MLLCSDSHSNLYSNPVPIHVEILRESHSHGNSHSHAHLYLTALENTKNSVHLYRSGRGDDFA